MNPQYTLQKLLTVLVMILTPVLICLASVRLVINPIFLQIEYHMPGFPEDSYGLTQADRLKWAPYAVNYLVNSAGIEYLADLKFEDGAPLYNQRELDHMVDVKKLVQLSIQVLNGSAAALIILGVAAWFFKWGSNFWTGVIRGGWLVIGLIALMICGVFIDFSALFTEFHRLFFTGDTWLFYYSDTLIRLFPMRFWQDAFITVGALSTTGGLLCALGFRKLAR